MGRLEKLRSELIISPSVRHIAITKIIKFVFVSNLILNPHGAQFKAAGKKCLISLVLSLPHQTSSK